MTNGIEVALNVSGNALKGIELWKSAFKSTAPVLASVQKNVTSLGQAQNLTTAAFKSAADGIKKPLEAQKEQVKTVGQQMKDFFEEFVEKSKKFRETTDLIAGSAKTAFDNFTKSSGQAFDNLFSNVFTKKITSFREVWSAFTEDMKNAFLNVLAKMVSGIAQENLLKPH